MVSTPPFSLGLSYSPYLTVLDSEDNAKKDKLLHIKHYQTGEVVVSTHDRKKPNTKESIQKPPSNIGQREREGLSNRGKRRLRRGAQYYDMLQGELGAKNMITLTYGSKNLSTHEESKKDLDRFLKSLSRYVKARGEEVHYVWVAEIQEKRKARTGEDAIHFHIMTPHYVPKELVNKWWNNAVNKARAKQGKETQKLYPNVIACHHAGAYMAKYLSKEGHKIKGNGYNMSQATSKGIKPIHEIYALTSEECNAVYDNLEDCNTSQTSFNDKDHEGLNRILWMPEVNEHLFKETLRQIEVYNDLSKQRKPRQNGEYVYQGRRAQTTISTKRPNVKCESIKAHERFNLS